VCWSVASCGFVADADISEEHTDSMFRVDVCRFRNQLFLLGVLGTLVYPPCNLPVYV
jgi:hypothetical protein